MMESNAPFFILGAQRSGTTMLRLMLNQHSRLAVPHETGFITTFYHRLVEYGDLADRANAERLLDAIAQHPLVRRGNHIPDRARVLERPISDFRSLVDAILSAYAESLGKRRWGDKTPYYTPDIDLLWKIFPGTKFVHLVRDGRDVLLSQRKIEWLSNNVPRLAQDWRWKTTICHKVGSVLGPEHYLELRYEDLVREPEKQLSEICTFLGEDFEPAMLEYHRQATDVVPEESLKWHRNSVQAPTEAKLFKWKEKLSTADRTIYEQNAGDTLALFGYELEGRPSSLSSKLHAAYYALFKRW